MERPVSTQASAPLLPALFGGERRAAENGETLEAINPATGELIGFVPRCRQQDIAIAVAAARAAFPSWRSTHPEARAERLRALAAAIEVAEAPAPPPVAPSAEPAADAAKAFAGGSGARVFNPGPERVIGEHVIASGESDVPPDVADLLVGRGDEGGGLASAAGCVRVYPVGHPKESLTAEAKDRAEAVYDRFASANASNRSNGSRLRRSR